MTVSNYPNGISSFGVPVLGSGPIFTTGKIFFVHYTVGSNGNSGKDPGKPFKTLDYAVGRCTANKGDYIILMPGHVEDLADTTTTGAMDLDVAGITVLGVGSGLDQPRIDFNHADSDFLVGANGVTIENVHFSATVTGVKLGIAIETTVTDTSIRNCRFIAETVGTDEFVVSINLAAACDRTLIEGCKIDMGASGGATDGIKLTDASAEVVIRGCYIKGDYSTACITSDTAASTETIIEFCMLIQGTTGAMNAVAAISMFTGNTGIVRRNDIVCDVATHILMTLGDTMVFFENYKSDEATPAIVGFATSATAVASADG
jgi:hypothetical protein